MGVRGLKEQKENTEGTQRVYLWKTAITSKTGKIKGGGDQNPEAWRRGLQSPRMGCCLAGWLVLLLQELEKTLKS